MEIYLEIVNPNLKSCSLCHQHYGVAEVTGNEGSCGNDIRRDEPLCQKCVGIVENLIQARNEFFNRLTELLSITGRQVSDEERAQIASKLCHPVEITGSSGHLESESAIIPTTENFRTGTCPLLTFAKHVTSSMQEEDVTDGTGCTTIPSESEPVIGNIIFSSLNEPKVDVEGSKCLQGIYDNDSKGSGSQSTANADEKSVLQPCDNQVASLVTTSSSSAADFSTKGLNIPKNTPITKKQRKQHICSVCNKSCKTARELDLHVGVHSQERKYICEVCGLAYRHKKALEVHVALHRGEAKFECEHCHKVFTQKSGLQRHLPIHTGEMAYQCDICGKRFLYNTSFNVHKFTHTKHKGFQCFECGLSFFSKSHLKRHMKTHTGVKPHVCDKCGKCFSERYNLEAHARIHTGQKRHSCSHCDAGFNRKRKLDDHLRQKHPGMPCD